MAMELLALALFTLVAASSGQAEFAPLALDSFFEASLPGGESAFYRVWLSAQTGDVKVVLLPLEGDTDVLVSFDASSATAEGGSSSLAAASWSLQGHGVEELLLRRDVFCRATTMLQQPQPSAAAPTSCYLYLRVRGYYDEATSYKIGVLDARDVFSSGAECHPGCSLQLLSNRRCDAACNVTACAFDRGACVPQLAAACSPGCQPEWIHDGECDDACYTEECKWDATDCDEIDIEGCGAWMPGSNPLRVSPVCRPEGSLCGLC